MTDLHGCRCKENSWTAVLDQMPPGPNKLTVEGQCTCPTVGYATTLSKAIPQGIDPLILVLDLATKAPSGTVNQLVTDYTATYVESPSPSYRAVEIRPCELTIPVKNIS